MYTYLKLSPTTSIHFIADHVADKMPPISPTYYILNCIHDNWEKGDEKHALIECRNSLRETSLDFRPCNFYLSKSKLILW